MKQGIAWEIQSMISYITQSVMIKLGLPGPPEYEEELPTLNPKAYLYVFKSSILHFHQLLRTR